MLSTENIWQSVPKNNPSEFEEGKKAQETFIDRDGDHITLINVYAQWESHNSSQDWAMDNYVNQRSLLQASDIRHQLKHILRTVKISALPEEVLYEEFKNTLISPSLKIRLSLAIGFYMNAARAVACGQEGSYLSVKDATMLHIDKFASVAILQCYPKWIIYTMLSGNTLSHGTIKLLSRVKSIWLEKLVTKLENVNENKLMGVLENHKRSREDSKKIEENNGVQDVQEKVQEARLRYLKRKKLNS